MHLALAAIMSGLLGLQLYTLGYVYRLWLYLISVGTLVVWYFWVDYSDMMDLFAAAGVISEWQAAVLRGGTSRSI